MPPLDTGFDCPEVVNLVMTEITSVRNGLLTADRDDTCQRRHHDDHHDDDRHHRVPTPCHTRFTKTTLEARSGAAA